MTFFFHCIDLIIPPSFTKKLKKMDSIKGSSIDLECIVAGSHPISIQWFKDDQEITASEKYKFSFHDNTAFLEISQLEGSDSGTYTCSATNKAGHNQCSGHLTVKGWQILSLPLENLLLSHFLILSLTDQFYNKPSFPLLLLLLSPQNPLTSWKSHSHKMSIPIQGFS